MFQFAGECNRETLVEAYEDEVYSATGAIPRSCTKSAEEDFDEKLSAAGISIDDLCSQVYSTAEEVPFYSASKRGKDMLFEQMFYNGRTDWQEEVETIYETDDESATSVLKQDAENIRAFYESAAQGRRVAWPGALTNFQSSETDGAGNPTCTTNAAMCCWPKDRQANDGNGNCAKGYDVNCVSKDPADNTNLCHVDMERGNGSTGFDSAGFLGYEGDNNAGEGAIHCHGLAWSNDVNDHTARYRGNNIFFVSMFDHMYQRGYVENIPGAPMCGCVEQMPTVTRSDCTQVDLTESIKIAFDSRSSTFTGKLTDVHIDFNACRGIHNQNNDLWAYMARLYYQGDITPNQFGEAGRIITNGHCVESDRYALNEKNLHVGYDADADRWTQVAGRDELYEGPPFGRNMFMKSFFEHSLTAPRQENIVNGTFSAGETPIMMRVCATCQSTHRYVFYRRLTPVTDLNINLLGQILYHRGDAGGNNVWNEDFTLHSTYDEAVSGTNPWKCPGDTFNNGAPFVGDCSPDGTRVQNQYSIWNWSDGPSKDVAYYVNKPRDVGLATLDLNTSLRFSAALHTDVDLGHVGSEGRTFESDDGSLHMIGSGQDIWGHKDAGHYFSEPYSGDIVVKVHVSGMTGEYFRDWAKAGIMLRTDNSPDATNAFLNLSGRKGVWLNTRRSKSGSTEAKVPNNLRDYTNRDSAWLKVVKKFDQIEGFVSYDGGDKGTWNFLGSDTVYFPEDEYRVGLAVTSNRNDWPAEASFEDYSLEQYSAPTVAPTVSMAPTTWEPLTDMNVQREGQFEADPSNVGDKLLGSGTGLTGTTDSFMFYNQRVLDDSMTVELDVLKLNSWEVYSRGGIMLRDTLADNSEYVFVGVAGARQGAVLQSRASAGQRTVHHKMIFTSNSGNNNAFVKLEYAKSPTEGGFGQVTAYYKVSAEDEWNLLGQTAFKATGSHVLLGRAVTAGSDHSHALAELRAKPLVIN